MDIYMDVKAATQQIKECQKVLTAIGDENRQHLLVEMMLMNDCRTAKIG